MLNVHTVDSSSCVRIQIYWIGVQWNRSERFDWTPIHPVKNRVCEANALLFMCLLPSSGEIFSLQKENEVEDPVF
jgi:hypothetical protein